MLDRAANYGDRGFWVRQAHRHLFENQINSAVIRLGDRSDPAHKNHIPADERLPVRFIAKPGPPVMGGKGNLLPDDGTTFIRTTCEVKTIGELTEDDFNRLAAPDMASQELVRYHLATVNDTPLPPLDTVVTIWGFEHAEKEPDPSEAETR